MYDEGYDNGYSYRLLHKVAVIAKKSHICDVCGKSIKAGTKYYSHAMIYDGDFLYQKEHYIPCMED